MCCDHHSSWELTLRVGPAMTHIRDGEMTAIICPSSSKSPTPTAQHMKTHLAFWQEAFYFSPVAITEKCRVKDQRPPLKSLLSGFSSPIPKISSHKIGSLSGVLTCYACGRFTEICGRVKKWSSEFKQRELSANHECWMGSRQDRGTRPPEQTRETGEAAYFPATSIHIPHSKHLEGCD